MVQQIKAIPTTYQGTRFRSRLEADWAAHFDARRLPWDYEPEGYQLSDGTWYSPDFWLPTARAWVEVKGDHDQRISKLEQFAADLWAESGATTTYDPNAPMVILLRTPRRDPNHGSGVLITGGTPMGIMGPGKAYSTCWARCLTCRASTIVALWQTNCRNCGHVYGDGYEAWADLDWMYSQFDGGVPFVRLPRPAGHSR